MSTKPAIAANSRGLAMAWLMVGSIAIILAAAIAQTSAGSYTMTWGQAWAALTDRGVWGQPAVLLRLFFGESLSLIHI